MSRREEVDKFDAQLREGGTEWETCFDMMAIEARTLADEVDERDAVITKLLAMLEPGEEPKEPYPSATSYEHQLASIKRKLWVQRDVFHARACEIAGRVK